MKKLKNINWKQAFVNHGEKVVFGLVLVFGLGALAMSRWAPYRDKNPWQLEQDVIAAKEAHKVSTWPEEKKAELTTVDDISAKAESLLTALSEAKFAFGRSLPGMWDPIIPQQQPIDDIKWFPVQRLVADAGTVLYEKMPVFDETLVAAEDAAETTAADQKDSGIAGRNLGDFAPKANNTQGAYGGGYGLDGAVPGMGLPGGRAPAGARGAAGNRGAAGAQGAGARGATGTAGARGAGAAGARGAAGNRGPGARGAAPGGMMAPGTDGGYGEYGEYGMGMAATPTEGEAKRYVSVRGVFPIKQQEQELARAFGAQSAAQVVDLLQFVDFKLQRQKAVPGSDPWSGDWEPIDIQVAKDVLKDAAFFDMDVVDPTVLSNVFTMPLPGRLIGNWDDRNASHPLLTNFELSEDAKKQQEWLNARIAEYAKMLEEQNRDLVTPGGFADQQYDAGRVGRMMMEDASYMNELSSMPMPGGQPGVAGTTMTKEQIKDFITASGTFMLYRYIDFNVEPGNAYRYRVQLEVMNPAHGLEPGEVARPDIAEGKTRLTEWSEPTPPVIVPKDTRHFLAGIEPGNARQSDRARFEMFQWSEEFGTIVHEFLPVEPAQFIAGTTSAEVLDPAAQTFEPKDFTFTSGDMLVDIAMEPTNLAAARPELGLKRNFQIPSQVLIVNDWGGLEVQDQYAMADLRSAYQNIIESIATEFDYLKQPDPAAAGAYGEGAYGEGGAGGYGEGGYGNTRGRGRGSNPLRRGGQGGYGGGP